MASISIRQLAAAMCRKTFAELVTYQLNTRSCADLGTAIDEARCCLPPDIQLEIEEILKKSSRIAADKRLWGSDCGKALRFFTSMIEKHLAERFLSVTEKELIEMFHIIVLHYASRTRNDPRLRSFLQKKSPLRQQRRLPAAAAVSCLS
jgi:hypothetical protein